MILSFNRNQTRLDVFNEIARQERNDINIYGNPTIPRERFQLIFTSTTTVSLNINRDTFQMNLLCASTFVRWIYMSPKIPANVFRKFFIVSSVSSLWDWLPCLWKGILDGGGSSGRRPTDGALLVVLDCDAVDKESFENCLQPYSALRRCFERRIIPVKRHGVLSESK